MHAATEAANEAYRLGQKPAEILPKSSRGSHTDDERLERLRFVGAVVAQLLENGAATYHGLKSFPRHESMLDQSKAFNPNEDQRAMWKRPDADIWKKLESCSHNADSLALAAAYLGKIVRQERHGSLRGKGSVPPKEHSECRAKRESSDKHYWKAIDGMNKQTVFYWKKKRALDYARALAWLATVLKEQGLKERPVKGVPTLLRDDIDYRLTRIVRQP